MACRDNLIIRVGRNGIIQLGRHVGRDRLPRLGETVMSLAPIARRRGVDLGKLEIGDPVLKVVGAAEC